MAVAVAIPMVGISPRQIDDARQRAVAACNAAYAPQPVVQRDGSMLPLCWMGRISRAYQMLQSAETPDVVRQAITVLEGKARAAFNAAEKAASDYTALCIAAGLTVAADVYPPTCACEGCRLAGARMVYAAALAEMREAAYGLLLPAHVDAPLPVLVELVEATGEKQEAGRKELWERVCRLALTQKKLREAADALGETVNWQKVLA